MNTLRGTLVADGSGDKTLVRILEWLLNDLGFDRCKINWANLQVVRNPPAELHEKIREALGLFPCEILFVHRDAEGQTVQQRRQEILKALATIDQTHVCVVPVRMTEAWLLFDEASIRSASGNPSGSVSLKLPPLNRVEAIRDPKKTLRSALRRASGRKGRRLHQFNDAKAVHRLADSISGFAPLRQLNAFQEMERELSQALERLKPTN